jgi:hypothetical protein
VTTRAIVEALESLPTQPWPARFNSSIVDGRITLTVPESTVDGYGYAATRAHLAEQGLDVDLRTVHACDPRVLHRVRADLVETTFGA